MKHKKVKKGSTPVYPSTFGSHATMLAEEYETFNDGGTDKVVCEDDHGLYVTTRAILDSGFADYNRSAPILKRNTLFTEFKAILDGK